VYRRETSLLFEYRHSRLYNMTSDGPLAQLVEHLTFNQGVAGSIPARPTIHVQSFILLDKFLKSRRQGSSIRTIEFYECCLKPFVLDYELTTDGINQFLRSRTCGNGKHGYYRAIRAFCNWLYKNRYVKSNPIENVDPPKQSKRLLPCLNEDEVEYILEQADNVRDKAIISLFVDSGIRLSELVNIRMDDIDWKDRTVTVIGKGNKQRRAPFGKRTEELLNEYLKVGRVNKVSKKAYIGIWNMNRRGIQIMLYRLAIKTGLPCNPHVFRRTFASNLHRAGMDIEHVMRLGG
jgi:integrase/recombinase XerD